MPEHRRWRHNQLSVDQFLPVAFVFFWYGFEIINGQPSEGDCHGSAFA